VRPLGVPVAAVLMRLMRLTARRAGIAVVYHSLATRTGDPESELVAPHGVDLFEAQLRHMAAAFRVVDATELPEAVARRRRGERFPAAVTFDDDLDSHVSLALPILQRVGVPATFFLTGATLNGPFSFWWERLQQVVDFDGQRLAEVFAAVGAAPPDARRTGTIHELGLLVERLDPAERASFDEVLDDPAVMPKVGLPAERVRSLVEAAGTSFGFHTRRHHYLPTLDDEALAEAFEEGRPELEELVGQRLTAIAYPYGAADERVAAAARRAAFVVGYTGSDKAACPDDDLLLLGRLEPSHRSVGHFALQLVTLLFRARC
jgi:peptidoglycan/xylan/chitin deacetylase (PgdA/CDA1 family)